jgi:hypothetical protein
MSEIIKKGVGEKDFTKDSRGKISEECFYDVLDIFMLCEVGGIYRILNDRSILSYTSLATGLHYSKL